MTQAGELLNELRALKDALDELDQAVGKQFGINRADLHCLELLTRCGPMQPKDLAEAMGYTTGGITTVIDRLEMAGLADRSPNRNDKRAVLVAARRRLPAGWQRAASEWLQAAEACTSRYTDDDLVLIRDGLLVLREIVNGYVSILPG